MSTIVMLQVCMDSLGDDAKSGITLIHMQLVLF